ncbi:hypothetical protein PQR33_05765 [Paraburkholderia sediminicola]|uniref:HAD domain-containing protein n=1 Tax=Paraburkholderia sediminicola TaxID=458836 RepID=UPI0038B94680
MTTAADGRSAAAQRAAPPAKLDERASVAFLDIDNTLHASDAYFLDGRVTAGSSASVLFEFAPVPERLLTPYPSLVIILSSSWVEVLGYEFTVAQLPSNSLQARVRSATFEREDAADDGWPALPLDDEACGAPAGFEKHFLHTNTGIALGARETPERLKEWLGANGNARR